MNEETILRAQINLQRASRTASRPRDEYDSYDEEQGSEIALYESAEEIGFALESQVRVFAD